MAMYTDNSGWIKLASLPDTFYANKVFNINANKFIATRNRKITGSFKYNIHQNAWNAFIEYSPDQTWPSHYDWIAFNTRKQILYFQRKYEIHSINCRTHQHNCVEDNQQILNKVHYFLLINNYFHMISNHDKHWIGYIQNHKLVTVQNTMQNEDVYTVDGGIAIYVSSKNLIVLIGGWYCWGNCLIQTDVWVYSLSSEKWKKIPNISFDRYSFGAVLSSDQCYIVFCGGYDENDQSVEDIFVLDMNDDDNWKIKRSKILCPLSGKCHVVKTGGDDSANKILVIGFVKQCFKMKEFEYLSLPPMYIIMLIGKWFSTEIIHLIKKENHYGLYLKDILSSM